jgi:hypothetical protein
MHKSLRWDMAYWRGDMVYCLRSLSFDASVCGGSYMLCEGRGLFGWELRRLISKVIYAMSFVSLSALLAACGVVDTYNSRAGTMNRALTDYRNEATLLNIVRASRSEPMNFVALTGATGHTTLGGSQGFPTITVGPDIPVISAMTTPTRNFGFGPNTFNESIGVDFTVSILDDPTSYSALMTPLDPAMMAFFLARGLRPPQLIPLFFKEIRIIKGDSIYSYYTNHSPNSPLFICKSRQMPLRCEYNTVGASTKEERVLCESSNVFCFPPAEVVIGYLTSRGINFQTPIGSSPVFQQQAAIRARICFDPVYAGTFARTDNSDFFSTAMKALYSLSKEAVYTAADSGSQPRHSDITRLAFLKRHTACDDPDTPWITLSPPGQIQAPSGGQQSSGGTNSTSSAASRVVEQTLSVAEPSYEIFDEKSGSLIQFFPRSTWGLYQFLGDIVRNRREWHLTPPGGLQDDHTLFKVVADRSEECFVSVVYSGTTYCVPKDKYNTKMTLSILHELVNLYTRPNNSVQPNSGTARITP